MEKYYIGKLSEPSGEFVQTKLVDIQFARRPPTFGTLHLATEADTRDSKTQQLLKLHTLNLTNEQAARFASIQEINLTAILSEAANQKAARLVDFNTLNDQLLLEVSHSSTSIERLRSSCFTLTQSGDLFAISLIDSSVKLVITSSGASQRVTGGNSGGERFLTFKLSSQKQENVLDHQLASKSQPALEVHVLSEQTYYHYELRVKNAKLDCDVQLLNKYSAQDGDRISRSLKFTQFWPISKRRPAETIVLLKLNDNSRRFVNKGKCLHSFESGKSGADESEILVLPPSAEQETILLEYFNHKLVAYSLLINDDQQVVRNANEELAKDESPSDPDNLLPGAPSFELEECWSYELAEIDGVRARLMEETDDNSQRGKALLSGCMCPLWLPEARASSSSSKHANDQDDDFTGTSTTRGWPKFILVAAYSQLLLFCFEHEQALPFSVVYDRAFLGLMGGESGQSGERIQQQATAGKSVDLKLRPRLTFNFKLIGQSPTDSLMNLLFLTQKIHFTELKFFNRLGLFVGATSENYLLAFKLTSPAVIKHKDNLYQQSLLASLKQPGLLSDEIQRMERANAKLVERLAALEAGHLDLKQTKGADEIGSLIHVALKPDELIGGLNNLQIVWPNLANLRRAIVISTVNLRFMHIEDNKQRIKSMDLNNFDESDDDASSSLKREALFLDLNANELSGSTLVSNELTHLESSIRAWAIVELDRVRNFAPLASNPFAEESLSLPLFLLDSQQFDGEIRVYLVFNNPIPPGFGARNSSLTGEMRLRKAMGPIEESLKLPNKFIKCHVSVKPLHSYRSAGELDEKAKKMSPALKLEIRGPFEDERMLSWLSECLDIDSSKVQNQIKVGDKSDNVIFKFSSNFSHCFLLIQLRKRPISDRSHPGGEVAICSDDFLALTLIEKHLFKRATDESIQLTRSDGRSLMVGNENLHHLISNQFQNVDLYLSLKQKQGLSFSHNQLDDDKKRRQVDLLLENLMSEALDLESLPIKSELKQSNSWLEQSFRRDLERMVIAQELTNPKDGTRSQNRLDTFLDMICGYLIDALVDYDQLHQAKRHTDACMLKMRSKLLSSVDEPKFSDPVKFAERVLTDWNELKRTEN